MGSSKWAVSSGSRGVGGRKTAYSCTGQGTVAFHGVMIPAASSDRQRVATAAWAMLKERDARLGGVMLAGSVHALWVPVWEGHH